MNCLLAAAEGLGTLRPSFSRRLTGNLASLFWGQLLRPCSRALAAHSLGGFVLAVVSLGVFVGLTRRDLHDADGVADHVGGALLAFRSCRHVSSDQCLAFSMPEMWRGCDGAFNPVKFQTETLPRKASGRSSTRVLIF